jgi:hypothetical protein
MRSASWRVLVASIFLADALASCSNPAPTEEEIKAEFSRYVNGANTCETASECTLARPGCPLGCYVAVRSEKKAAVEDKAASLIRAWSADDKACFHKCLQPGEIRCLERRCALAPSPSLPAVAPEGGTVP